MFHSFLPGGAIFLVVLLCFALPGSAAVLVVGPPGSYTEIQPAIDAASDGDVILVKSGTYGSGVIQSKSLTIASDAGATSSAERFEVRDLAAGQRVVILGFTVGQPADETETIRLTDNQGAVRIEQCTINGRTGNNDYTHPDGWNAVHIEACADSAFIDCNIKGGNGHYHYPPGDIAPTGDGAIAILSTQGSTVALYDCKCNAGDGGNNNHNCSGDGGDGGHGYVCDDGFLFAAGTVFDGGGGGYGGDESMLGGNMPGDGGDGGHGLWLSGPAAEAHLLENNYTAGSGGWGGEGLTWPNGASGQHGETIKSDGGLVDHLTGDLRSFEIITNPVREYGITFFVFDGFYGDSVGLFINALPDTGYWPSLKGPFLLSWTPPPLVKFVCNLPTSGHHVWVLVIPDLGPGFEAGTFHIQSIFRGLGGETLFGPEQTLVVVSDMY